MVQFFECLKEMAEQNMSGQKVKGAVITVSQDLSEEKKNLRKFAATQAGINVLSLVTEPVAAAVAAGLHIRDTAQTAIIFDCAYSGAKVSVIQTDGAGSIDVKASHCTQELGGLAIDNLIFDYFSEEFKIKSGGGVDLANNEWAKQRMISVAEKAKIDLSIQHTTQVRLL